MSKLYNNEKSLARGLKKFFNNIDFKLSIPQFKVLPYIITSMINAENVTTTDMAKLYID